MLKSLIVRVCLLLYLYGEFSVQSCAQTTSPVRLLNQSFPDRRLWVTSVGYGLPDCNSCYGVYYGELYPLNMREGVSAPIIRPTTIDRMVQAGITGHQRLVLSGAGVAAGNWLRGPLTEADAYPGFIVVP